MGLSLPKSNLIFLKKCLDKWVHFRQLYDKLIHGKIGRNSEQKEGGREPHRSPAKV